MSSRKFAPGEAQFRQGAHTAEVTFGQRVRSLRLSRKLGQAELAAAIDVSVTTISEWETNKKHATGGHQAALARFFGVTIDFLAQGILPPDGMIELSADEQLVVKLFRSLPEDQKATVIMMLRGLARPNEPPAN